MSHDLSVPLDLLEATAGELDLLISEFHSSDEIVNEARGDVGSGTVIGALEDFASNWKTHKDELLTKMTAVRDMAAKGREAFIEADSKLAADIRDSLVKGQK